jgi:hypothetical protein
MSELSIEDRVQNIKTKVANAQREQIRAEQVYDSAKASAEKIRDKLKAEFGVETAEEAKQMLATLKAKLEDSLNQAQRGLDEIG